MNLFNVYKFSKFRFSYILNKDERKLDHVGDIVIKGKN